MAVNLINSNDINIVQSDTDISLETNKTTLNTIIDSRINGIFQPIDFSSSVDYAIGETKANVTFKKINNLIIINYQGENKTHNANDLLFTLPSGYRPPNLIVISFTKWGVAYGQVNLNTDGTCKINSISSTSASARIAFCVSYTLN